MALMEGSYLVKKTNDSLRNQRDIHRAEMIGVIIHLHNEEILIYNWYPSLLAIEYILQAMNIQGTLHGSRSFQHLFTKLGLRCTKPVEKELKNDRQIQISR
ncbi:hypothetical protein ElyMa_005594800 [Elysia marginata]|uniref:PiggyBac transposable element-derived protein domain-containing protein n=1 Tax=Elysia marginata TaxID=1093978 RepID=A0AAV4F3G6_9GAST|nr:hypothetical protein ElyMa_005594800 [Elysia marginata]